MLSLPAGAAWSQTYPARPIRLVVPFPAGATDSLSRLVGARVATALGQPVVVEQMPGAGGAIGYAAVAKAPADGYTLVMVANSLITAPLLGKVAYDASDFVPIGLLATAPSFLVTRPQAPYKTLSEFLAWAKSGKATYASAGNGTLGHLLAEWFKAETGLDLLHVPYKGGSPALLDVMAGQVDVTFDQMSTSMPQIRGGKLQALGVTSAQRVADAPEVPTMEEAGLPGFQGSGWFALLAPVGTPSTALDPLRRVVTGIMQMPDVKAEIARLGMLPDTGRPEQFLELRKTETQRWTRIIKVAGIKTG